MKASEAIKQIQKLIKEHGDLPLDICFDDGKQDEVKEICWGGYGKYSEFPNRNYIVLLNYKQ